MADEPLRLAPGGAGVLEPGQARGREREDALPTILAGLLGDEPGADQRGSLAASVVRSIASRAARWPTGDGPSTSSRERIEYSVVRSP